MTYILQDEIPELTWPYIDDVSIRGPATHYELEEGGYEIIPENDDIRWFVWEHMNTMNRIVQHIKYAGGTFSGTKPILCADEITVVGHLYTYEGGSLKPSAMQWLWDEEIVGT